MISRRDAGYGIREMLRAGYGKNIIGGIGMSSFQLMGCGIVFEIDSGMWDLNSK